MITIESKATGAAIKMFEDVDEISQEYLDEILSAVELVPHYVVVALIRRVKLFDLVVSVNDPKKTAMTSIVLLIAKVREESNLKVGRIPVTDRSSIERGIHVAVPCVLCADQIGGFFAADKELIKSILQGKYEGVSEKNNPIGIVMEFKIIPESDIVGMIDGNKPIIDTCVIEGELN